MLGSELFPHKHYISAGFALIAGLLLPLSLAPFEFWWSGIVSVVLLLALLQGASFRQALLRWYLFGFGQYLLGASWVYVSIHTHGGASVLLAASLTGGFVALMALTVLLQGYLFQKFFASSAAWVLAFPSLWFFKEWTMTWALSAGFPWALLGYGHVHSPFSGYAPIFGVLGVGFLVCSSATLLFAGLVQQRQKRSPWLAGSIGLILLGGLLGLLSHTQPGGEPLKISLIQGNIAQETKWRASMVEPIVRQYVGLSRQEWGRDLIVWPEAAITLFADAASPVLDPLDAQGKASGTALMLGIPRREEGVYYNSAMVLGEGAGLYTKRHLVPFGEYVPLEDYLRGVIQFFDLPMSHNKPGPADQALLKVADRQIALSICYEIAFPALVRKDVADADLLVTLSNDTWFGESLGPHQHMQMAQMRALENSRYLLRATNNGITAVVNEKGQIIDRLPQFEAGVLRSTVIPLEGVTPYSRLGDWPLLVILSLLLGYLRLTRAD